MRPQVLANLIIFIAYGYHTLSHTDFDTDISINVLLVVTVFSTALNFYYLNIAFEESSFLPNNISNSLSKNRKIANWFILTLQFTGFHALWHFLGSSLLYYAIDLFVLYSSYVVWNILFNRLILESIEMNSLYSDAQKQFTKIKYRMVKLFDIVGFGFSTLFLALINWGFIPHDLTTVESSRNGLLVSLIMASLIFISLFSFIVSSFFIFKYNPLKLLDTDGNHLK